MKQDDGTARNAFPERFRRCQTCAIKLAENGWTIPPYASFGDIDEIYQAVFVDGRESDQVIVDLYRSRYPDGIDRIFRRLLGASGMNQWHSTISEVQTAFSIELYRVSIAALLPVLEGVYAKSVGRLRAQVNFKNELTKHIKHVDTDALHSVAELSISHYLLNVFKRAPFQQNEPTVLNRHWVVHGRTLQEMGKADCLRVLQALSFYDYLMNGSGT